MKRLLAAATLVAPSLLLMKQVKLEFDGTFGNSKSAVIGLVECS
jgi:hypothetical protein